MRNENLGFFDKFRIPRSLRPDNWLLAEREARDELRRERWPWPNIDRPAVQRKQEETAFHEAGHAVVARYFGMKVDQLSIRFQFEGPWPGPYVKCGSVRISRDSALWTRVFRTEREAALADGNPDSPCRAPFVLGPRDLFDDEASLCAELHVTVAGVAAARKKGHCSNNSYGDSSNFRRLVSCCYGGPSGFVPGSSVVLLRRRYLSSCHEILSNKPGLWGWINVVAKAALRSEHGVLTGDEIESLRPSRSLPPDRPPPLLPSAA